MPGSRTIKKAHGGLSPIRLGHETCGNVGHEHGRQGHQKVLDAMEATALRVLSDVLPLSYAVDAMRTITSSAEPGADVARDILIVLAFVS
jgi:hypothetical protein